MSKNLKDSPDNFLETNIISETNVDSNNIQNKNTKSESTIDEMTVVKVNETFVLQLERKYRRHTHNR